MLMITATSSFLHLSKRIVFFVFAVMLVSISVGCRKPTDISHTFGKQKDLTEDLHHRLKADMFEIGKEPVVCRITQIANSGANMPELISAPHEIARISWDRGAFRVRSDDLGFIVIYMDEEVLFSHVHVATHERFVVNLLFFEEIKHPVR